MHRSARLHLLPPGQLGRHLPRGLLLPRGRPPCQDVPWGHLVGPDSAVGSTYLESCQDNTSVSIAIVITIFLVLLAVFICAFYTSFEWDPRPPICVAHMPKYAPVPYCPEQPGKYVCPNPGCPITRCPT